MSAPRHLSQTVRAVLSRRYVAAKTTSTRVTGSGFTVAYDHSGVIVRDEVPPHASSERTFTKSRERLDAYAATLRDAGLTVRVRGGVPAPVLAVSGTVSEKTRVELKRN